MPNERILDNLRKTVRKAATMVWVRYPVIPQFNDTHEEIEELCRFVLAEVPSVEKLSLLPYHKFAEAKYNALGREYPYKGIPLQTEERIEDLKKLAESHGLRVDVGR
jgi:pyruvate formate lyase activating enzyme